MKPAIGITVIIVALFATALWWRYRSVACPARLAWLLENPYMKALAGADIVLERMTLKQGMRVLDVGCGPGRLSLPAARQVGTSGEVVALDIQQKMLDKLRARATAMDIDNIRMVHAGAGSGAIEHNAFDRALLVTVLGEIPDQTAALAEIFQALKPGGILSVTEVIPDPHYTSRNRLRRLCGSAGFVGTGYYGNPLAYTMNFVKPAGTPRSDASHVR